MREVNRGQVFAVTAFGLSVACCQLQLLLRTGGLLLDLVAVIGLLASLVTVAHFWRLPVAMHTNGGFVAVCWAFMASLMVCAMTTTRTLPAHDSLALLVCVILAALPALAAAYLVHVDHLRQNAPGSHVFARVTPVPWSENVILSLGDGESAVQVMGARDRLEAVATLLSEGVEA
ncbi:MAG: hypothetical protein ACI81R_001913 [Bradymonadia bacterium]|jgi:hypothetical protein